MNIDMHIHFDEQSPEGLALEAIVSRYRISPEEALRTGRANENQANVRQGSSPQR